MNLIDLYYKKTIYYKQDRYDLQFKISQELFSSLDIDHGTQRLLRTLLFENINAYRKVLDLGCGYGPIGITMKKACPSAEVHMVDIDALALEFARENAHLNGFTDLQVYASLGYDQVVDHDFDVIVSNIPAKIGDKAIKHMLKDARYHLVKGGKVIVVVIDAVADFVRNQLESDGDISITYHRSWPGHHVYHYQFVGDQSHTRELEPAFERGVFFRGSQEFQNNNEKYSFNVSYNLSEFDQLSFQTKLLSRMVRGISDPVELGMCFGVGQGHVPLLVAKHFRLDYIRLVDRDLLALKTAQKNLNKYSITAELMHSVFPQSQEEIDLIVGAIPEKQSPEVYAAFSKSLGESLHTVGKVIIVSSSTTISRIEEFLRSDFEILAKEKDKGNTALILRK